MLSRISRSVSDMGLDDNRIDENRVRVVGTFSAVAATTTNARRKLVINLFLKNGDANFI